MLVGWNNIPSHTNVNIGIDDAEIYNGIWGVKREGRELVIHNVEIFIKGVAASQSVVKGLQRAALITAETMVDEFLRGNIA